MAATPVLCCLFYFTEDKQSHSLEKKKPYSALNFRSADTNRGKKHPNRRLAWLLDQHHALYTAGPPVIGIYTNTLILCERCTYHYPKKRQHARNRDTHGSADADGARMLSFHQRHIIIMCCASQTHTDRWLYALTHGFYIKPELKSRSIFGSCQPQHVWWGAQRTHHRDKTI